jgi:hypothetical protein
VYFVPLDDARLTAQSLWKRDILMFFTTLVGFRERLACGGAVQRDYSSAMALLRARICALGKQKG